MLPLRVSGLFPVFAINSSSSIVAGSFKLKDLVGGGIEGCGSDDFAALVNALFMAVRLGFKGLKCLNYVRVIWVLNIWQSVYPDPRL